MPYLYGEDLLGVAVASLLAVPLILLPGYGLGWWLDLFDFRSLSPATKWSLVPGLGLAVVPIMVYLPFRLLSVHAAWGMVALLCGAGVFACARRNTFPGWHAVPRSAKVVVVLWSAICIGLMLDVAVGSRLYPSSIIIDTSFRSQIISSLANSYKLPPDSYFSFPGHSVPLRYHYIYFIIPALTVKVGRGIVPSSAALVMVTLWTGLGFFGVISAFLRFFWMPEAPERCRKIAWALVCVSGLDILFAGTEMIRRWWSGQFIFTAFDIGLWNGLGSVFGWLSTVLIAPHHLVGLMAGVLGCILLWHSRNKIGWRRWSSACGASLAFATLSGTSVYIAAIFAFFLCMVLLELLLNAPKYAVPLVFAGASAAALILPFLVEVLLSGSGSAPASYRFEIRGFLPITLLFAALGIHSTVAWNLSYLFSLPLAYLCQFGVFFVGGIWWLFKRVRHPAESRFRDHMIIGLMTISIVIPSFVWSGLPETNELGFRGALPAQFLLLICTSEFMIWGNERTSSRAMRRLMQVAVAFIELGVGSTLLEMVVLRGAIGTTAEHTIQVGTLFRSDISADRFASLREAYSWIRRNTPKSAVIQENPVSWQMIPLAQYSERRTAVYGSYPVGEAERQEDVGIAKDVHALFAAGANWRTVVDSCSRLGITYVVVQKGDDAWTDPASYVWIRRPEFGNRMVHVYRCDVGTAAKLTE